MPIRSPQRNTQPLWRRDRVVTASTSVGASDDAIMADATSGNIVLTPPRAVDARGRSITVVKVDSSVNTVAFSPQSPDTVNGSASNTLSTQYAKATYSAVKTAEPSTYNWIITRS